MEPQFESQRTPAPRQPAPETSETAPMNTATAPVFSLQASSATPPDPSLQADTSDSPKNLASEESLQTNPATTVQRASEESTQANPDTTLQLSNEESTQTNPATTVQLASEGTTQPNPTAPLQLNADESTLQDLGKRLKDPKAKDSVTEAERDQGHQAATKLGQQEWARIFLLLKDVNAEAEIADIRSTIEQGLQALPNSDLEDKKQRIDYLKKLRDIQINAAIPGSGAGGRGLELLVKYWVYKSRSGPQPKSGDWFTVIHQGIQKLADPNYVLQGGDTNPNANDLLDLNRFASKFEYYRQLDKYGIGYQQLAPEKDKPQAPKPKDPSAKGKPGGKAGGRTVTGGSAKVRVYKQLKASHLKKLEAFLKAMKPEGEGENIPHSGKSSYLSRRELYAVLKLMHKPKAQRDKILEELKPKVCLMLDASDPLELADLIAHAEVKVKLNDFTENLSVDPYEQAELEEEYKFKFAGERTDEPKANYPVKGKVLPQRAVSPGVETSFHFQEEDPVYDDRVPHIQIQWRATRTKVDGSKDFIDSETTTYLPLRGHGLLNDQLFTVKFPEEGTYTIHAVVHHNHYRGIQYIEQPVTVQKDDKRLAQTDADKGLKVTSETDTTFGDGSGPENQGKRLEASMKPEDLKNLKETSGLQQLNREIADVQALLLKYEKDPEGEAAATWAKRRLTQLKEYQKQIWSARYKDGNHQVGVLGHYAARKDGVRDTPLKLSGYWTGTPLGEARDGEPGKVKLTANLYDQTELEGSQQYAFEESTEVEDSPEAKATAYEALWKTVFERLADAYPTGSVRFFFEGYDGAEFTGNMVGFNGKTDSLLKDAADALYQEHVSLLVNTGAGILSVFPPTAPVGIGIGLLYNGSEAVYNLSRDLNKGTTGTHNLVDIGAVILDIVPVLGKAAKIGQGHRFLNLAKKAHWGANAAANGYLFADSVYKQIQHVQNGSLKQMVALEQEVEVLVRNQAGDAILAPKLKALERMKEQVRYQTIKIFTEAAAQQLLTMASQKYVQQMAMGKAGARMKRQELLKQSDEGLMQALEGKLGGKDIPPVIKDPALGDSQEVRVYFELGDFGEVKDIVLRTGSQATPGLIEEHAATVKLLQKYQGLSGTLRTVHGKIHNKVTNSSEKHPIDGALFEAQAEVRKLTAMVQHRRQLLAEKGLGAEDNAAAKIEAEIADLETQLAKHQQTLDRGIEGQGRSYVAAEDRGKKKKKTNGSTPKKASGEEGGPAKDFTADLVEGELIYLSQEKKENERYGVFRGIVMKEVDGKLTPMVQVDMQNSGKRTSKKHSAGIKYYRLDEFNARVAKGTFILRGDLYKKLSEDRPKHPKSMVMEVWNAAKKKGGGVVREPDGKKRIIHWDEKSSREGIWDMGHKDGEEYNKQVRKLCNREITYEEFLEHYFNPDNYQPEFPSENRRKGGKQK